MAEEVESLAAARRRQKGKSEEDSTPKANVVAQTILEAHNLITDKGGTVYEWNGVF